MTTQEVLNRLKVLSHELEDSEDIKAIDEARRIISEYPHRFINTDERRKNPDGIYCATCQYGKTVHGGFQITLIIGLSSRRRTPMLTIDMEIPSRCNECPFQDYEEGRCLATEKPNGTMNDPYALGRVTPRNGVKPDWCPLKEFCPPVKVACEITLDERKLWKIMDEAIEKAMERAAADASS